MAQGKKWHEDDDKALCYGWVRSSHDAKKGADQTSTEFRDAVDAFFKEQGRPERTRKALRNRWSTLRHDVSKFVGIFSQAERNSRSGSSPDDVLATACAVYAERHGGPFEYMHCWEILKAYPKFSAPSDPKRKYTGSARGSESQHPGQKKAKFDDQQAVMRQRELKRLDRIASAMEEKNRIMQYRMMLRYGAAEERQAALEALKSAVARAADTAEGEEEAKESEVTFSESTVV